VSAPFHFQGYKRTKGAHGVVTSVQEDDLGESDAPRERVIEVSADELDPRVVREIKRAAREMAVEFAAAVQPVNHGKVHFNGSTKLVMGILSVFGVVMTSLLVLILQALYTTNGTVSEVKGQANDTQAQVAEMRREMSAFQSEMMALAQRQANGS
jgi:hypothetical protein